MFVVSGFSSWTSFTLYQLQCRIFFCKFGYRLEYAGEENLRESLKLFDWMTPVFLSTICWVSIAMDVIL